MTKKIKSSKLFSFCFVFLSLGICLSCADLFSSMITVGGFNFTSNTINFAGFNMYAISVGSSVNKSIATDMSTLAMQQNGAGYIYSYDGTYYVLASMYENEADAQKVKNNLTESKFTAQIITIKFEPIILANSLTDEEKSILTNTINSFKSTFKRLYDIAVSLDTNVINEISAKLEVNTIKNDISKANNNFNTIFSTTLTTDLTSIKTALNKLESSLNLLVSNNSTNYTYSCYIKNEYINTMINYKNLTESLINK